MEAGRVRLGTRRREGLRPLIPVVDPRLLGPTQRLTHLPRHLRRTRPRPTQQLREQAPHQRHRQTRIFFSPTATALTARTTTPRRTASGGGANPSNCVPHNDSAPLLACLPPAIPRCRDAGCGPRLPAPTPAYET